MNKIINKILLEVSLDSRIEDGIFDIKNNQHIGYLYEYFINKNINDDIVLEFIQPLMEKGKHPERQAYNLNGLLVTFPTPEYKARALARGTHFEKNPKVDQSNLFGGGQQAPNAASPTPTPLSNSPMDAGSSILPPSDSNQPQTVPAKKEVPEPGTPGTQSSPPNVVTPVTVGTPAQGTLATEPIPTTTIPANVSPPQPAPVPTTVKKTPQEIAAEREVIKQIMSTSNTLPSIPEGSIKIEEQIEILKKIALHLNLNEAAKFLSFNSFS